MIVASMGANSSRSPTEGLASEQAQEIALFGVNKFLASGRSTNSDWGRAPIRLNATVERQVLDQGHIASLLKVFESQPWVRGGTRTADRWQAEALAACEYAIQKSESTSFTVHVDGKDVKNYIAVGPGKSILLCWEGSWEDRRGNKHYEIMYQAVVPYLDGLSQSARLREFLKKFENAESRRVMLPDWNATDSVQFRQACKAIWNLFPDLTTASVVGTLEDDVTCTICLDDIAKGTKYVALLDIDFTETDALCCRTKCGHFFHAACVGAWIAQEATPSCPVCRQSP